MLVGMFGGTFDPVHNGHFHVAATVQATLGLQEIRWLLAARPGHRTTPAASIEHRWNMLEQVCALRAEFVADDTEIKAPGTTYTINTVLAIRRSEPDVFPCWIMGLDAFATLDEWYRWDELLAHCNLIVVERPNDDSRLPATVKELEQQCGQDELQADKLGQIVRVELPMLPISATMVRDKLRRGESVEQLIDPTVNSYINQHQLYAEVAA